MAVAAAIVGGAVIGGIATNMAADSAADATSSAAASQAQATVQATNSQIAEIGRQFDYQQAVLRPLMQQQYAAGSAYMDLLGVGGGPGQPPPPPGPFAATTREGQPGSNIIQRPPESYAQAAPDTQATVERPLHYGYVDTESDATWEETWGQHPYTLQQQGQAQQQQQQQTQQQQAPPRRAPLIPAPYPGSGSTQFQRGTQGQFIDPNLDPTRLADVNTLGDTVRQNLLAGTSQAEDPYAQYVRDNQLAAGTSAEDERVRRANEVRLAEGAAGTGVYGDVFQESPGYAFQVEQMGRELDRRNSRGGNYGGRAVMESQRRAQGLAAGDYYNWAQGRERDLVRRGGAEATDVQRGDLALSGYESQRIADVGRGDAAFENYLGRQQGDASRLDAAAAQEDRLLAADQSRQDQAYYNYLNQLAGAAGFGNAAGQAVQSSQAAGGAVAGAYGQQGSQLSNIYGALGQNQAAIGMGEAANYNNILQGSLSNYTTYQQSQQSQQQPSIYQDQYGTDNTQYNTQYEL